MEKRSWYALYTKPRWEKKVNELLHKKGFESYCPLNKVRRKWSDRYKVIEEPLFKSYVFVCLSDKEKTDVRMLDGVVNFVYWLGKPARVKQEEIEKIKRFLGEHSHVEVEQLPALEPGVKVVINAGVFMDHEARVITEGKKDVELLIESLGLKLVARIGKDKVSIQS
ncbi:UpxY family transcription antiterminator [Flavihumibacter rivuli]|uniref:UpxY family transcription antiterminator n=1 Tax=Flavihumibacter rivuli TaxID=2838156 RepID=UPI001BDE16CF|nr:UpxY family transcription antiterminator [Flavihumibacter rivuli]ULQ56246.1 UpxY family transcription antiterminator [Flavihumibacter rivuli]